MPKVGRPFAAFITGNIIITYLSSAFRAECMGIKPNVGETSIAGKARANPAGDINFTLSHVDKDQEERGADNLKTLKPLKKHNKSLKL